MEIISIKFKYLNIIYMQRKVILKYENLYINFGNITSCMFYMVWIYYKDKYEKEPVVKLVQYFFMGILVSILAIFEELYLSKFNNLSGIESNIYISFLVAGFTEEGLKSIVLIPMLLREKNFNEKLDGIIYSVFLSLGFATSRKYYII